MVAVRKDAPWKDIAELTSAMKLKGEKGTYGFATPIAKAIGAMYKEKAGLRRWTWPTVPALTFLTISRAAMLIMLLPTIFRRWHRTERANEIARRRLKRADAGCKGHSHFERVWVRRRIFERGGARWCRVTPRPIVDQLNLWVNQVVRSDDAKKFLNDVASDPWVSTPDAAQTYFIQQIKDWGDYIRIAKIEPLG